MDKLINKRISGYKIICNFNNERVLAYSRTAPQQWVVWRVDNDGDMYWGKYFSEAVEARRCFLRSVADTRTTFKEIEGIQDLRTMMLDGYLILRYKSDTNTYDICSNHNFDFDNDPQRAWKVYLRELGTMTMKQVFEILNLEKMTAGA